mmetsp:Transcript_57188/g.165720  ORF Transcript_57188/g.165720 Transcript_57188/m.165720 type:complete len:103 (-) Transcript_57188:621-929(-)
MRPIGSAGMSRGIVIVRVASEMTMHAGCTVNGLRATMGLVDAIQNSTWDARKSTGMHITGGDVESGNGDGVAGMDSLRARARDIPAAAFSKSGSNSSTDKMM